MMIPPTSTAANQFEAQCARLRQFLVWLIPIAFTFTAVYAVAFVIFRVPAIAVVGFLCFLFGISLLVAWGFLRRKRLTLAVYTTCASLLLLAFSGSLAFPAISSVLTIIALVAVIVALPYVSGRAVFGLIIATLCTVIVVQLVGEFVQLLPPLPLSLTRFIRVSATTAAAAMLLLLLWQFSNRLTESLAQMRRANTDLQAMRDDLEELVVARTSALQAALGEVESHAANQERLLAENTQQREMIRGLSVPVLPVMSDTLIMPLVGTLDQARLEQMQQQALQAIERSAARRLLLDITGVPFLDSDVAQGLVSVVQAARLLGAEVVLVGIRPEVAQTVVGLGLDLRGMRTFNDLQTALGLEQHTR